MTNKEKPAADARVKALTEVTVEVLKKAPPWLAGFVYAGFAVILLALVVTGDFLLKDQHVLALYVFGGTLAFFLVLCVFLLLVVKHAVPSATLAPPPSVAVDVKWWRPMLKMPWHTEELEELFGDIEAVRNKAHAFLSEKGIAAIRPDNLRINVFLPDYANTSDGEVCSLAMVPQLCLGMKGAPDEGVRFHVNQGVTGRTFRGKQQIVARVMDVVAGDEDFNDVYELTAEQKKRIHPELKWIVSSPLKIDYQGTGKYRTIGVLNIDGLMHDVETSLLQNLARTIAEDMVKLSRPLSRFSFVEGVIGVREASHV